MRRCISCSIRKSSYPLNPLCNFKMFWSEPTVATPDDIAAICNLEREADKLGLLCFFFKIIQWIMSKDVGLQTLWQPSRKLVFFNVLFHPLTKAGAFLSPEYNFDILKWWVHGPNARLLPMSIQIYDWLMRSSSVIRLWNDEGLSHE